VCHLLLALLRRLLLLRRGLGLVLALGLRRLPMLTDRRAWRLGWRRLVGRGSADLRWLLGALLRLLALGLRLRL
jgi:hypothetical protein